MNLLGYRKPQTNLTVRFIITYLITQGMAAKQLKAFCVRSYCTSSRLIGNCQKDLLPFKLAPKRYLITRQETEMLAQLLVWS